MREGQALTDLRGKREVGPAMHLEILFAAEGYSVVSGSTERYPFKPNTVSLQVTSSAVVAEFFIPAGAVIRSLAVRFSGLYLDHLASKGGFAALCSGGGDPLLLSRGVDLVMRPLSPALRPLASQILATEGATDGERLFLEAKILELISVVLSTPASGGGQSQTEPTKTALSRRDHKKIGQARELLIGDLDKTWKIKDLARHVGMNENKLKAGFRQIYDNSIYAYLQDWRMRAASHRLKQGEDSVTGVALSVGYSNPAHFAKVFRRYFGVSPSRYAEDGAPGPKKDNETY
ncbi:AraC family transcriptional regulator [Rhodospirillum rubrum F11]|nr:AraC family transcriptional regulator [Rhodospirillum rubrum F11]